MAHIQTKSEHNEKATESKITKSVTQAPNEVDKGGSWQFMFIMGVIGLGVLMMILKLVGLL